MYDAGRLGRGIAGVDGPGAHLLNTGSEIGLQAKELIADAYDAVQAGLLHAHVIKEHFLVLVGQVGDLRFDRRADGHHRCAFLFGVILDLCKQRVVGESMLTDVGHIHGRFHGE